MTRKRMYRPGRKLTLAQVVKRVVAGQYVIWRHKPVHPSFVSSWPLNYIRCEVANRVFREAIRND